MGVFATILWFWFAADKVDNFSIEVEETFKIWESTDFSITAVKDGEVFKEYSGMIFIWIKESNWNYLDDAYYEVSNGWRYQFLDVDQWQKTFSKWLKITKAWTYILQIEDPSDWWKWEATIIVQWDTQSSSTENITISYPISSSVESKSFLNVLWSCEKLKNSPVILYLNGKIANSWYTDNKWNFSVLVWDFLSGENEIQAKIVDINNVVLWESPVISITYQSVQEGMLKSIEILPSREVKQWDKMNFNVGTDDSVSSAQLVFSNGLKYSMDRIWQWLFTKEISTATFFGNIDVSVSLVENWNEKVYENKDVFSVQEYIWISNIKFAASWVDGSQVIVSWETIWSIEKFVVNYGTNKDNLANSETVSSSTVLINNLQKDTSYYFQIVPIDTSDSHKIWEASEIVEYHPAALSCVVKWIKVTTEQIWDNYYLVWDPVENAISYEVYKSDWADMTDARLVWSLTGTRFQYLFDKDSKKDEYAFYQVQAICPDWNNVVVDKAQKVKVWPVENLLLIIIISIFVYSLYRLHKISNKEI